MDEQSEVQQLEVLCKQLYESQEASLRSEAEKALVNFQNSPDSLNKCQLLLDRSDSPYSQLLATTTLTKLISRTVQVLSLQQKIDIRNYVLTYLYNQPKLTPFVVQGLVTLFARITKLGWFDTKEDNYVFRKVIEDITKFLQGSSADHCMMGVQLLSQLTCEMNQVSEADANRSLTKHRKIASSFRDTHLFEIFQLSCTLLRTAYDNRKNLNFNDESQHELLKQLLRLAHNCLTFDFIGTSTDESADDLCTLFFDLYGALPYTISPLAISCLVQIASVRRSLFSNTERPKFLDQLVSGVREILQNPTGLTDPNNYHEFCRLLARLKSNYQLGELVLVSYYPDAIRLMAKFTVESLRLWQFAPNSIHYLLSLWQRMVASTPYVKSSEPHLIETYTPEVTQAYITSRLESVEVVIRDNLEDPLDDTGMVSQQLEQLSVIGRCEYTKTCTLLVQLFNSAASSYQEMISNMNTPKIEITIQESRLSWLVYIIGASVGGRGSFNSNDGHDAMDGELVCRVLQLMNLTDSRLVGQGGCEKLELALLSFFEQFRKIYVGDQVQKTVKIYRRLSEVLGLNDESMILSVIVRKIITNLKYWGGSEQIISKTLNLLLELSVGYGTVRKLVKLEEIAFLLSHHTAEHYPFLGVGVPVTEMRCRSTFYTALGRLFMVDLGEDEEKFDAFMIPLTQSFESLGAVLSNSSNGYNSEEVRKTVIGLARDVKGIAYAFNTKVSYMMLFDWIYPAYTPILQRAIEIWYQDPQVTTPILKLFAELVQNRSQRLMFDVSSPNGILLFREASKIICSYGSRILNLNVGKEDIYRLKLKGISICFSIMKAALCGSYVNFGVFLGTVYFFVGPFGISEIISNLLRFIGMPCSRSYEFPRATMEAQVFLYILSTISEGLTAIDTMVCTGCCTTLDHIVTYLFKQVSMKGKTRRGQTVQENDALVQAIKMRPEILQQMLSTVLNIIMFEDCRNQWSMSRPLLGLILLNEDYFQQFRDQVIQSQLASKQANMQVWFKNLMVGIERNLLTKNRDRFTQNLTTFRRDINDALKGSNVTTNTVNDMMTS
ncbi:XPO7 [Lepeophtheirus salmonis]|uniref:XPO7 n=1 Tax=Lepeophtheirus salmonis TaxID=72036 RepID=A0A7R8HCW2_LEPSM|nr:XPO7 [Lepeophtheirus salmonis]CAF3018771.1 XPO7 [Lepeophtheirus salmonis]